MTNLQLYAWPYQLMLGTSELGGGVVTFCILAHAPLLTKYSDI